MGNVTYLISNYGLDFLNLFALSKKPDGKTGFSDGDVITQGDGSIVLFSQEYSIIILGVMIWRDKLGKKARVENDEYFQVVIRYIHQNPLKAGMVDDIKDYKWSSYNEYIDKAKFCEIDFALDMLSKDRSQSIEMFKKYNNTKNQDQCLDYDMVKRLKDSEARELIIEIAGVGNPTEIAKFDKVRRRDCMMKSWLQVD